MSIRRISDLPLVPYAISSVTCNNLNGDPALTYSALEMSYNTNGDEHSQFQSRQIMFKDLSGMMLHNIWSENCTFDGDKTFNGQVNFANNLKLSGSLYLNEPGNPGQNVLSVNVNNIQEKAANYANYLSRSSISVDAPTINVTSRDNLNVNANNIAEKCNLYCLSADTINLSSTQMLSVQAPKGFQINLAGNDLEDFKNFRVVRGNDLIFRTTSDNTVKFTNTIYGTALKAMWADLAENYATDFKYEPGTLVKFGGEKEITIADDYADAVVTTNPGFVLNSEKEDSIGIALVGRVPVKVIGPVDKFDDLILSPYENGIASTYKYAIEREDVSFLSKMKSFFKPFSTRIVAKALQSNDQNGIKLVECVVKMEL